MLAVSGKLNLKAGPSVMVPVDPDLVKFLYKPSQWAVTSDRTEHDRRSVYGGGATSGCRSWKRSISPICFRAVRAAGRARTPRGARNDERPARRRSRRRLPGGSRAGPVPTTGRSSGERISSRWVALRMRTSDSFSLDFSRNQPLRGSRSRSSTSTPFSMHPDAPREHARLARTRRVSPATAVVSAGWRLPRSCMRRPAESVAGKSARAQGAAAAGEGEVGDLRLHGRRPEPHRDVRSETAAERAQRSDAASEFGEAKYQFVSRPRNCSGPSARSKNTARAGIDVSDLFPHLATCADDLAIMVVLPEIRSFIRRRSTVVQRSGRAEGAEHGLLDHVRARERAIRCPAMS